MPRIQSLLMSLALVAGAGISTPALAHPVAVRFGAGVSVSLPALVDRVSPYGSWVDDGTYGRVFLPTAEYTPYTNGYWDGDTWVEDASDPIGSIVCHYGRWEFADAYGRYVWIPDTTWIPGYRFQPRYVAPATRVYNWGWRGRDWHRERYFYAQPSVRYQARSYSTPRYEERRVPQYHGGGYVNRGGGYVNRGDGHVNRGGGYEHRGGGQEHRGGGYRH